MGIYSAEETDLGVDKSTMDEVREDLKGRLAVISGLVDVPDNIKKKIMSPIVVIGDPGIGKSESIQGVVDEINAKLRERASSGDPESEKFKDIQFGFKKIFLGQEGDGELQGMPFAINGKLHQLQSPKLPNAEEDGDYGVLFLDEVTTADEYKVQPALGLMDGTRNIGKYTLPPNWYVICAGNGPNCPNFVKLYPVLVDRGTLYDISIRYDKDWRPWALQNGVKDEILAFLNFDNSYLSMVNTDVSDDVAKKSPNPRTWTILSDRLQFREYTGNPVPDSQLAHFCGNVVGKEAAAAFTSFLEATKVAKYDPVKISDGEERDPDPKNMTKEVFFATLQACTKYLVNGVKDFDNGDGTVDEGCYTEVANTVKWFIKAEKWDLDSAATAIMQIRNDDERLKNILKDSKFSDYCPELDDFIDRHSDVLFANLDALQMQL